MRYDPTTPFQARVMLPSMQLAAKLALESVRKEIEGSRETRFGQGGHSDHQGGQAEGRGVKQAGQSGRGRGRGRKREEEQVSGERLTL